MANIGYARVSSVGQTLDVQQDKLKAYGVTKTYQEKKSGANTKDRPELTVMLDYVREGDKVVITKLDRLGRSVMDLTKIVATLEEKGVNLIVIDQQMDTSTSQGKLMFHMLASFAEFERSMIKERQMDGIAKAKADGKHLGRRPTITDKVKQSVLADVAAGGLSKQKIADKNGISRAKLYQIIND